MKIGIVTFTVDNFGAQLQAYALSTYLSGLGHDVEIVDVPLIPATQSIRRKAKIEEWLRAFFSCDFFRTCRRVFVRGGGNCKGQGFGEFKKKFLKMSSPVSVEDLRKDQMPYDVYVCGSDQVWSYTMSKNLDVYLLGFTQRPKFAYAASFGVSSLPSRYGALYSKSLSRFRSIGVRERTGLEILTRLGVDAKVVVDPTFLLRKPEWNALFEMSIVPSVPYIFVYDLIQSEHLAKYVKYLAREKGLAVVSPEGKNPCEFVTLLANAKYVVTSSFHGLALSLNLGPNFVVVCRKSKNTNSRMIDLCMRYGLHDHILYEGCSFFIPAEIDGVRLEQVLNQDIDDSKEFISESLAKCQMLCE